MAAKSKEANRESVELSPFEEKLLRGGYPVEEEKEGRELQEVFQKAKERVEGVYARERIGYPFYKDGEGDTEATMWAIKVFAEAIFRVIEEAGYDDLSDSFVDAVLETTSLWIMAGYTPEDRGRLLVQYLDGDAEPTSVFESPKDV